MKLIGMPFKRRFSCTNTFALKTFKNEFSAKFTQKKEVL